VGNPSQNGQADSIGSIWCPCLAVVGPTSDFLVDVAVRSPGADRLRPVGIDEVEMVAVLRAETVNRCDCRD
jgi:hypothetical protein